MNNKKNIQYDMRTVYGILFEQARPKVVYLLQLCVHRTRIAYNNSDNARAARTLYSHLVPFERQRRFNVSNIIIKIFNNNKKKFNYYCLKRARAR